MKVSEALRQENTPLLLLIPIFVYYILGLTDSWIPSADSAYYISLAKSILSGRGFTYMGEPDTSFRLLFPLILAPVLGLSGTNFLLMRLLVIVLGVGSLGLVYLLFKQVKGPRWGLLMMLLTGVSEHHYLYSHYILSDIPYTFFSLLALWYFLKNMEQSGRRPMFILAGLLLAAFFTRRVGAIIFVSVILFKLFEARKINTIILLLTFLIPIGLWSYRNHTVSPKKQVQVHRKKSLEEESKYVALKKTFFLNIRYYRERATVLLLTHRYEYNIHALRLIPVLLIIGFIGSLLKQRTVIEYYMLMYILAYMFYPYYTQGVRYYIPVLPFLIYYLLFGIILIVNFTAKLLKLKISATGVFKGVATVFMVTVLFNLQMQASWGVMGHLKNKDYYREAKENLLASIQWVKNNTGPDDVVISDRAAWVYFLSDRKAYGYKRVADSKEVLSSIMPKKPDYIIDSKVTGYARYLHQVLNDYPHLFAEVYRKGDSVVYKSLIGNEGNIIFKDKQ